MSKQEKFAKDWRAILEEEDSAKNAEREPERENLDLTAGKWSIKLLSEGEPYSFDVPQSDGTTKTVNGVAFVCNAKHLDTGENHPNVNWGITATTLRRALAQFEKLNGVTIKFLASGEGRDRRYSEISVTE